MKGYCFTNQQEKDHLELRKTRQLAGLGAGEGGKPRMYVSKQAVARGLLRCCRTLQNRSVRGKETDICL